MDNKYAGCDPHQPPEQGTVLRGQRSEESTTVSRRRRVMCERMRWAVLGLVRPTPPNFSNFSSHRNHINY